MQEVQVKQYVQYIIHSEIERLLNDPSLKYLVIKKCKFSLFDNRNFRVFIDSGRPQSYL